MKKWIAATALITAMTAIRLAQDWKRVRTYLSSVSPATLSGPVNKIGPELNGLDGRKAGTVANFNYSEANKNSGVVWNEQTFKEYIKDPKAKIPGTKMIFAGVKNEQQASDL